VVSTRITLSQPGLAVVPSVSVVDDGRQSGGVFFINNNDNDDSGGRLEFVFPKLHRIVLGGRFVVGRYEKEATTTKSTATTAATVRDVDNDNNNDDGTTTGFISYGSRL
jgi:hypothetical protein